MLYPIAQDILVHSGIPLRLRNLHAPLRHQPNRLDAAIPCELPSPTSAIVSCILKPDRRDGTYAVALPMFRGKHRGRKILGDGSVRADRPLYPGLRPTIALARASIVTRPLASTGTCSRTRVLSCDMSAGVIVASFGAIFGAAIVVDQ
jgi:hypothetical protein